MVSITALWQPIIVAAVFVFIGSSILHMVLPFHKSDYKKMANEGPVLDAVRNATSGPGVYMFPACDPKDHKNPEVQEKFKKGPVGIITLRPSGAMNMGAFLGQWFVYCLLVSLAAGKIAAMVMPMGEPYIHVFKVVFGASFMAYSLANIPNSIWTGQPWSVCIKHMIDGAIYAGLTAGTFGWLWPR